ncbi:amidase [Candidatus Poriferisodalis sp.]|uniref:amidase n=1 Tax=Candidatus Poriferisodalis sp. TaxID=3101277 RepID=UPI003B029F08
MTATIADLATGYRDGSRSPVEATEECLAAIESLDGRVGAWQAVYADEALAAAKAAGMAVTSARDSGAPLGPFFGVPFALKDIVEVEGRVTTAGSAEWVDRVSPTTAVVAQRLLDAGGILVGKTKTVEFAMGGWGTNQHMGTPRNPWDADVLRTPGGSSSGSGAAVASGMTPCAMGTDTGGSVRLPAALCGIVGLKTTEGLLPIDGIVPLSHTLDTPGPLTRTVMDAALMFDAMLGMPPAEVERDWLAGTGRCGALRATLEGGLAGRRIGCLSDAERAGVEAPQLSAYDAALEVLAGLGAEVVPFDQPTSFEEMKSTRFVIVTAESYFYYGDLMEDPASKVDERVRARVLPGANISASDYIGAMVQRRFDLAEFAAAFEGFDAMVTPTTPMLPLPVDEADETNTPALFTRAANFLALCSTTVPTGVSPASPEGPAGGLPTSIQFMCRGGDETLSLELAAAYEAARGPMPTPPLWAGAPTGGVR